MSPTTKKLLSADCDLAFDNLTRQLYATDASLYQIEPIGVAFPRSAEQARSIITTAVDAGVSIIPRGAGSGLSGGAIGDGLVVDFSRHNREIGALDFDKRTVRVGAGVVLDQLNLFLKPHGFCFGPDVATSSRATLGGMIANNSSGARVPVYGTTADHVVSLEVVLADGRIENVATNGDSLPNERLLIAQLVQRHAADIAEWMPPGMLKRWSGYGLARFLQEPNDLTEIFSASEGTLGAICSAELNIVPLPREKGLGLVFFASVAEAMQATVELLDLEPSAIEHIDKPLFDQTRGQLHFQAARDLMELDIKPCEAVLIVEFYEDVAERLTRLAAKRLGLRTLICQSAVEMNLIWAMRKAGLSLLTGRVGPAKPVAFIEDAAIPPQQLPAYVAALDSLMTRLNLEVCYYGHAATGLLHVRPVLDLHIAEDRRKYREIADEVSALVRQFKGSLAGEHGVGIARTEYMRAQVGDDLLDVMRQIKRLFDPKNIFNPGKLIGDGEFKVDGHFRSTYTSHPNLPFEPRLAFAFKDGSFIGNLEQCNGCGGCRKDAPTMCPTFLATGEEYMSTRGRANAIRAALELRTESHDPLRAYEMEEALSNCLSCKACTMECPSNVNLALLKAELTYARVRRDGLSLRARLLSNVDLLGKLGCLMPRLANAALDNWFLRGMMSKSLGISAKRPLPHYAHDRFDKWFAKQESKSGTRGPVILWDDTFVRYHEPNIGIAAVTVLESLGFEVSLVRSRKCCGRPAFSQGNLDEARRLGEHNLNSLKDSEAPILFLEPSCYSMFAEDYREMNLAAATAIAPRAFLFERFVEDILVREPQALHFKEAPGHVAIHAHCHAKSLMQPSFMKQLAQRLPGRNVELLDTGCCGMAGAFGALEAKYELSLQVAQPLVRQIRAQLNECTIVASGTSCRHQIEHLTPVKPKHMAELLADSLA
ncbi:MAG: FAD-binding protein [Verrucomicrobiota bacterium]|nr:FAD-binding protein [Verrucomicrobiota bacterium]MDQ6939202.1 FAD-binding protein [Verrucomicrobiota bacterium]